nr:tudor and KH domain-containing protein homolog [Halyomorpha halys]
MVLMSKPLICSVALPILSIFTATIYYYFKNKKGMENTKDNGTKDVNIIVPLNTISSLIERGGTCLKKLQEKSQTKITLRYVEGEENCMTCRIVGKKENVEKAVSMIGNKINEVKKKKEDTIRSNHIRSHCLKDFHYEKLIEKSGGCLTYVFVPVVDSPSHFWIQFVSQKIIALQHLINDMSEYYDKKENRIRHKLSHVRPGQTVASMFLDGKWYRAEVLSVTMMETDVDESKVKVLYVDYGYSEYYTLKQIFGLKLDFLSLKFQAIEVSMAGIESNNGGEDWDGTSIEAFDHMVRLPGRLEPRLAEIISVKETKRATYSVSIPCIKLYYPDEPLGIDIGKQLVEKGFALEVETEEQ